MYPPDVLDFYRARSCSRQWAVFLQAMAAEFSAELSEHELIILMSRVGQRFARMQRLAVCKTLAEVEVEVNRIWQANEWGLCKMVERSDQVEIIHIGAPINIALASKDWTDGFLEGVYGVWFHELGMPQELTVQKVYADSADLRKFVLSKTA